MTPTPTMTETARVLLIVSDIHVNIFNSTMRIEVAEDFRRGVYLQVWCQRPDTYTGEMGWGQGGRAYLDYMASEEDIVATAFGLVKAYVEHEAREGFTYQALRVYGPHMNLDSLKRAARDSAPVALDEVPC